MRIGRKELRAAGDQNLAVATGSPHKVVEAPARSGALSTAGEAREIGRTVLSVPGPVDRGTHDGCHRLIRDGANEIRLVVDTWRDEMEGGPVLTFDQMASVHTSGLKVLPLTSSPMATELLEPQRVAGAIAVARRNGRIKPKQASRYRTHRE